MHGFMEEPRRNKINTTPKIQSGMRPDTKNGRQTALDRPW